MAFLLIMVYNIKLVMNEGKIACEKVSKKKHKAAKEETTLYTQNTIKKIFH